MKKSLKEIKILSAIVQKIKFKIFKNTFLQCRRNIWSLIRMIESQKEGREGRNLQVSGTGLTRRRKDGRHK